VERNRRIRVTSLVTYGFGVERKSSWANLEFSSSSIQRRALAAPTTWHDTEVENVQNALFKRTKRE